MTPSEPRVERAVPEPLIEIVQQGTGEGWPRVEGRCPSCGGASLFVGLGGYLTCSRLDCVDPTAAGDLLEEEPSHA